MFKQMEAKGGGTCIDSYYSGAMFENSADEVFRLVEHHMFHGGHLVEPYKMTSADLKLVNRAASAERIPIPRKHLRLPPKTFKERCRSLVSILQGARSVRESRLNELMKPTSGPAVVTPLPLTPPASKADTTSSASESAECFLPMNLDTNLSIGLTKAASPRLLPGDTISPRRGPKGITWADNSCFGAAVMPFLLSIMKPYLARNLAGARVYQALKGLYDIYMNDRPDELMSLRYLRAAVNSYDGQDFGTTSMEDAAMFFEAVVDCIEQELAAEFPATEGRPRARLAQWVRMKVSCSKCNYER